MPLNRSTLLILENQHAILDAISDIMIVMGTATPIELQPQKFKEKMLKCAEQMGATEAHIAWSIEKC